MGEVIPVRLHRGRGIEILDQTALPHDERILLLTDVPMLCEAIRALRVRGAPLLGAIGAAGMALAASTTGAADRPLRAAAAEIRGTRPTAVDLGAATYAALDRSLLLAEAEREAHLWQWAESYLARRVTEDRQMGALGATLFVPGTAVLTHCNTGALATCGIGSALGVIRTAFEHGRLARCYATETRPLLQGARLTMWELAKLGIPATLLPDTAAGSLIASGKVQAVITGADRIAANGDTANKVGTYALASVAARHGVPFYIAAPTSTIDPACADGAHIPIEFRPGDEVGGYGESRWAPAAVETYNPAFDVTPAALIDAIITEREVVRGPYAFGGRAGAERRTLPSPVGRGSAPRAAS